MDRVHTNPVLDIMMYLVEFAGGEVTELTNKLIAELTCAQCGAAGNEYLFLDSLIEYCKDDKAIPLLIKRPVCGPEQQPITPLQVGKFAASGRMVLPHGRSCPTYKYCIWCRKLNLVLCRRLIMSPLLTGG